MKTKRKLMQFGILIFLIASFLTGLAQPGPYPDTGPQSVCLNSDQPYGVINTPGSTYAWSIIPITGGNGTISGNGNSSITVLWTSVGTCTLQVIETQGSGCVGLPVTVTITVNPIPNVDPVNSVVYCAGATTTTISFTGLVAGTVYNWTNSDPSIGLAASGSGNILPFTATNSGSAPVVATITVTPVASSCTGTPITFTITVNPAPEVDQPVSQVVCNAAPTAAVVFTTSNTGGVTTYTWTNDTPGIGLAASGIGDIASFTAVNLGTSPVVATITVTPHFANGGVTCDGTPKTFTITVNPTGEVDQPASQVVCNGALTAAVNFTTNNTGGVTTYTWINDTPGIGLAANGSGDIAAFTAVNNGSLPVVATITVTPHFTNGSVTCDGPTQSFTITVNPAAEVDQPASQVVCNAAPTAAVVFTTSNTGGVTTYTWTNDTPGIGLAASGTGNIASFTAVNLGTSPVVATITVTPHFSNGGSSCDGTPKTFTITVNPTGEVDQPANQIVCNGALTAAVNFTTNNTGGVTTYTWMNDTPGIGLAANGSGDIAAFTAVNNGSLPVVATITVTPHFTNGSVTCDGPTQSFTITVNPAAEVDQPASQVVCNAAPTAAVVFTTSNTGGVTTYTWTNDTPGIGLAASGSGDIASFTAVNIGTSPVVATITVTPHFANGGSSCDGTPKTFTITVNPTGEVDQPASQVVCNAAPTAAVVFTTSNTGGVTTYTWTNDTPGIGLAASGSGDIGSFTAVNTGTLPVVATIIVTPHFTNGSVTCDGPTQTFTITVNPAAEVDQPANQVLCDGAQTNPVNFTTTNTGGVTTYTWVNNNPSIGLAASGSGDIASFTAINTGTIPVVATIIVTPHFTNGSVTCDGPTQTFTITVNPRPVPTIAGDTPVCLNSTETYTTEANMSNYTWTVTGGTFSGQGTNSISVTWTATGVQTVTVTYTNSFGCNPLTPTSYSVTVTQLPNTSPIYHN
jgi:hypothetical protein